MVRSIYDHHDPDLALEFVTRLGYDLEDRTCPLEIRRLGRTVIRWRHQIAGWHRAHLTNAATEAANNLIKRVKRAAFGFTRFRHFRVRALLYPGSPTGTYCHRHTPLNRGEPLKRVSAALTRPNGRSYRHLGCTKLWIPTKPL